MKIYLKKVAKANTLQLWHRCIQNLFTLSLFVYSAVQLTLN